MSYFKWIVCWFNKTHVFSRFVRRDGTHCLKCIRCGVERDV